MHRQAHFPRHLEHSNVHESACAAAGRGEAAPLVGGAMLTVILFPIVAMRLTGQAADRAMMHLNDRDGL